MKYMRGIVVARKVTKNLIFILVEDDCTLTFFDTTYCEDFKPGDLIRGELHALGYEMLYNETQQFEFDGTTQQIFVPPKPVYLPYYEFLKTLPVE